MYKIVLQYITVPVGLSELAVQTKEENLVDRNLSNSIASTNRGWQSLENGVWDETVFTRSFDVPTTLPFDVAV
jgi:hypothetical protein